MPTYSGEVVPTPGEEKPFKIVVRGPDGAVVLIFSHVRLRPDL